MTLSWIREENPVWDKDKERVIGGAPAGALDLHPEPGAPVLGDWWFVAGEDGCVVGYGWLDATWGGDAEIQLAVDPARQQEGIGGFILGRLEHQAAERGINYVYNTVRATHPYRDEVYDWLAVRGYRGSESATALRKCVVPASAPVPARSGPAVPPPRQDVTAWPPGREESGGYVDVEKHRF